jgi:hypothetical protein
MTVQFKVEWNGYDAGGVYTLSAPEEARLIAAGIAFNYVPVTQVQAGLTSAQLAAGAVAPAAVSSTGSILGADGAPVSGAGSTPVLVPFAMAIPLDATKRMPPSQITGATTFTVSGTPVAGGTCTLKLTANGVNTPVFPGIHWGGSAGWVNTAGTVNIVTIWNDGDATYYSVAQHQSAPITLPSLTLSAKSGASSPSILTLSLSAALGNSGALDASQFAVATTNGGAQTDNVLSASASGSTVTISMSRPATVGDTTAVSYTPSATPASRLVDASGNALYAISSAPVTVVTFLGALDGVSTTVALALGMRRLATSYTGNIIRIRNSAGTTADIAADQSGWASDTAITAHLALGNGTGSVAGFYIQAGPLAGTYLGAANGGAGWEATLVKVGARWMCFGLQSGATTPQGGGSFGSQYRLANQLGSAFANYTTGVKFGVCAVVTPPSANNGIFAGLNSSTATRFSAYGLTSSLQGTFGNSTGAPTGGLISAAGTHTAMLQASYIRGGASGDTCYIRKNGAQIATNTVAGATPASGTTYPFDLLADGQGSSTSAYGGQFGELIWFAGDPTGSDLSTVESRQVSAWGL